MNAIIVVVNASEAIELATTEPDEVSPEARETAARLTALLRHVFRYDRGNVLRVIEESGLTLTQSKVLLELGGLGCPGEAWQVSDLAELFGVSLPSMSRAVDALVTEGLATRIEDPDDRRVRRVGITAEGLGLAERLLAVRQSGMAAFAASLSATQRRKLDAAVDSLMEREDVAQAYRHLQREEPS